MRVSWSWRLLWGDYIGGAVVAAGQQLPVGRVQRSGYYIIHEIVAHYALTFRMAGQVGQTIMEPT